jgi:Domain of unknown function (DUF4328)
VRDRHPDIVAAPLARSGAAWHRCVRVSYQPPPPPSSGAPGAPAQYSPDGRWYWDGQQWLAVAAPGPAWAQPYAPSEGRATSAVTFVAIATAAQAVFFVGYGLTLAVAVAAPGSAMQIAGGLVLLLGEIVFLVGFVGSAVAVPMWMHRAYRNLPALRAQALRWSPGWAAGGWFIPFANLVIPFQVMRELWHHSGGCRSRRGRGRGGRRTSRAARWHTRPSWPPGAAWPAARPSASCRPSGTRSPGSC